jgi:hypothetical protein
MNLARTLNRFDLLQSADGEPTRSMTTEPNDIDLISSLKKVHDET